MPSGIKANWKPEVVCERIDQWHEVFRGRVIGGECTLYDARTVLQEPGWSVAFVDPPYPTDGEANREQYVTSGGALDLARLAATLSHTRKPWMLTVGDNAEEVIVKLFDEPAFEHIAEDVYRPSKDTTEPELWIIQGHYEPWHTEDFQISGTPTRI